uniref:Uncharacterized protein n=1 Tax=Tetradesmus obliquus TaxID=3088 RepID=A0A383VWY0_TETOB|eukprot:jgi/Sobl393_1/15554/SZX69711.1
MLLAAAAAVLLLLLLGTCPFASARPQPARVSGDTSDAATLTLHFYTKDSALLDREQAAAIRHVLAQHIFNVPEAQVSSIAGIKPAPGGQLSAAFLAEGPAFNMRSVLGNCQGNIPAMFGNRLIRGGLHNSTKALQQQQQQPQQVQVVGSTYYWWLDVVQGVKKAECAPV